MSRLQMRAERHDTASRIVCCPPSRLLFLCPAHFNNTLFMYRPHKNTHPPPRAANFSVEELPEVMGYLRARGVKGYVALNILVSHSHTECLSAGG